MKKASLGSWGERGFLAKILPRLRRVDKKRFSVPPGDDAAVMRTPFGAVLSMDGLTEGTHFKSSWTRLLRKRAHLSLGRALGWKLMGSSLSDLAAMGDVGERWALVFLGGPASVSSDFLMEFTKGVQESARRYQCALVGGDTVRAKNLSLVAAVGGQLKSRRALTRIGARVGDLLCVTGTVGDAERGVQILLGRVKSLPRAAENYFIHRFFNPVPLFQAGAILARDARVTSLIDLSDSLLESVQLLLVSGHLGGEIDVNSIPTSRIYRNHFDVQPSLLSGGEDYGLLFTLQEKGFAELKKKLSFSVIGRVLKSSNGIQTYFQGRRFRSPQPYQHFQ